jgi:hypothetical protein
MLQDFGTENAVERPVRKFQITRIDRDRDNTGNLEGWLFEIESRNFFEIRCQQTREVSITRTHVQDGASAFLGGDPKDWIRQKKSWVDSGSGSLPSE